MRFEEDDVLEGEGFDGLDAGEADGSHLFFELLDGHFVEGFDGDGGILFAVLDEGDAAVGLEGLADFGHDFKGVGELVVDVDEEDEVDGVGGEVGIGFGGLDDLNVGDFVGGGAGAEGCEHFGLDIDGEDFAVRGDFRGDAEGEVSGACSEIGDGLAWLETEGGEELGGVLFLLTGATVEPLDAAGAHDLGDFPAHVEFAGAVGVVVGAGFIGRWWGLRVKGGCGEDRGHEKGGEDGLFEVGHGGFSV